MTKRLGTLLASIVLGTMLLASGANAAAPSFESTSRSAIASETTPVLGEEGDRQALEGIHHRRFCLRLNAVLTRLVDAGVITREQKRPIMDAFDCVPPTTHRPATSRPTTLRPAAAQ
jgi:hypothetical protein